MAAIPQRFAIAVFVLASILSAGAGPAMSRDLLFDNSHAQPWSMASDGIWSSARDELIAAGHGISTLSGSPGAITAQALAGFDVFVLDTMTESLTAPEIDVLQAFVSEGGGLIVIQDGGANTGVPLLSINELVGHYGMEYWGVVVNGLGVEVTQLSDHCVMDGVHSLGFDYTRQITRFDAPAQNLFATWPSWLGVAETDTGWVIAIGDASQWSNVDANADANIDQHDNRKLLLNVFGFDLCQSAVESSSWSRVKSLF